MIPIRRPASSARGTSQPGPGHALERQRGIGAGARQRPGMIQRWRQGLHALQADPPEARLQSGHAAIGGGNADRAAGVGADRGEAETGGHRRRRAAAGTAGGAARVPGIVGLPEIRMHGAIGVFQQVGLAEDDGAGLPSGCAPARHPSSPVRGLPAREAKVVGTPAMSIRSLIAIGTPCSGPRSCPAFSSRSALSACGQAFGLQHRDEAVERRIEPRDPVQRSRGPPRPARESRFRYAAPSAAIEEKCISLSMPSPARRRSR